MKKKKAKKIAKKVDRLLRQVPCTTGSGPGPQSQYAVNCTGCYNAQWHYGIGGGAAESAGEAMISAYANGWYVANVYLCPQCVDKISEHRDNIQTINNESGTEESV